MTNSKGGVIITGKHNNDDKNDNDNNNYRGKRVGEHYSDCLWQMKIVLEHVIDK
jgi:hypothetical protein